MTIRVRYTRSQQYVTFRGVGVYGRINMSTNPHVLPPTAITGGNSQATYWNAILVQVAAAVLSL
jgi:hypothetical protein